MDKLGPPGDVPANELFLKLLEPQPSEVIDFPRKGPDGKAVEKIRIAVLPHEQHDRARILAFQYFKEKGYDRADLEHVSMREVVGDRVAKELIAIACLTAKEQFRDANGNPVYGRWFRNAEDVGQLRAHEVTVLFNAYKMVQEKYGPFEHSANVDAWVKRLVEGGETFPLLSLDLPELASLTSSLAERLSITYRVLASRWKELPDTCQSALERSCSGITSWSLPPDELHAFLESSAEFDIDVDDAVELSRKTSAADRLKDALSSDD